MSDEEALARCEKEIAEIRAEILSGNKDLAGLMLGLADWNAEKHLILASMQKRKEQSE